MYFLWRIDKIKLFKKYIPKKKYLKEKEKRDSNNVGTAVI